MKKSFLAVTLLALLVLGTRDLQAQAYSPYYYNPYWDAQYQQYQQYLQWQQYLAYLQQYDPYYDALPAVSASVPVVSTLSTLLLCGGCYRPRLVSADQSTAATDYESSIASVYWPAVAIGCRSDTASRRSTPRGGQSIATSDWKKVKEAGWVSEKP
jgi:hypothetical protein